MESQSSAYLLFKHHCPIEFCRMRTPNCPLCSCLLQIMHLKFCAFLCTSFCNFPLGCGSCSKKPWTMMKQSKVAEGKASGSQLYAMNHCLHVNSTTMWGLFKEEGAIGCWSIKWLIQLNTNAALNQREMVKLWSLLHLRVESGFWIAQRSKE